MEVSACIFHSDVIHIPRFPERNASPSPRTSASASTLGAHSCVLARISARRRTAAARRTSAFACATRLSARLFSLQLAPMCRRIHVSDVMKKFKRCMLSSLWPERLGMRSDSPHFLIECAEPIALTFLRRRGIIVSSVAPPRIDRERTHCDSCFDFHPDPSCATPSIVTTHGRLGASITLD